MNTIRVIDTSMLCVWLQVPGFDHSGPDNDSWNYDRIHKELQEAAKRGEEFVLPLAVIIETGNHIAQCVGDPFQVAQRLIDCIEKTANSQSPWIFFGHQTEFWNPENLTALAREWHCHVAARVSMGDVSIRRVAEHYAKTGANVLIFTGDAGLKAYQPIQAPLIPRRRR